jgi:hypothetical protein
MAFGTETRLRQESRYGSDKALPNGFLATATGPWPRHLADPDGQADGRQGVGGVGGVGNLDSERRWSSPCLSGRPLTALRLSRPALGAAGHSSHGAAMARAMAEVFRSIHSKHTCAMSFIYKNDGVVGRMFICPKSTLDSTFHSLAASLNLPSFKKQ